LGQRQGAGVIDESLPQGIHSENSPYHDNAGEGTFGNAELFQKQLNETKGQFLKEKEEITQALEQALQRACSLDQDLSDVKSKYSKLLNEHSSLQKQINSS